MTLKICACEKWRKAVQLVMKFFIFEYFSLKSDTFRTSQIAKTITNVIKTYQCTYKCNKYDVRYYISCRREKQDPFSIAKNWRNFKKPITAFKMKISLNKNWKLVHPDRKPFDTFCRTFCFKHQTLTWLRQRERNYWMICFLKIRNIMGTLFLHWFFWG